MKLSYHPYSLLFKHPFGVSGNTRNETPTIFIKLESENCVGYGEACLPIYLGETMEATCLFFEQATSLLKKHTTSSSITSILFELDKCNDGCNAAKAAIDIALHDLFAKQNNKSFCDWKDIEKKEGVSTSFTIGIDKEEVIIQKIKEASFFSILKIKAGTKNDKDLINLIRKHTNKPLYVDVNQGWTDKEYVINMIDWMKNKNVILLEQPMPKTMKVEMAWVTERSSILTIADESVKRLNDLEELNGAFSGINIKLMKCTGLAEALKMINYCKQHHLKILLGCMAESSCGTTAMAQLMGFADYVDLDAPLLYKNDPFDGVNYVDGKIYLNNRLGIGTEPLSINF